MKYVARDEDFAALTPEQQAQALAELQRRIEEQPDEKA